METSPASAPTAELLDAAVAARSTAYAPYSGFAVGAAIRLSSGSLFAGCNVENASYGLSNCAERVAVQRAVAAGELPDSRIVAVAVVADSPESVTPCGACRQVLLEFAAPDCVVLSANLKGATRSFVLRDLLPEAFTLSR